MSDFVPPVLPLETDETAGYFEGARAGELRILTCLACGRRRHPPCPACPWCHSTGREWKAVSGRGRVWSYVVPHPPLLPGFTELAPYNVVVVELDEDPTVRVVGNLVAEVGAAPTETAVTIGEPVRAVFHQVEDVGFLQWARSTG
ncbi:MAG TPA: OB-fold domain-containing protein [Acidimicrobiales bacterium]|nr:OB-fold domain-containing protein [Acidimicrobiales bacterium]